MSRKVKYGTGNQRERFIENLIWKRIETFFVYEASHLHQNVLDLGCGEQPFRKLIESTGRNYFSADLSQNSTGNVDCIIDLNNPIVPSRWNEFFDIILLTEVIEHIFDLNACFMALNKLLKPNCKVVITAPFIYPLHEIPFDYRRPTPYLIEKHSNLAGLDVVTSEKLGDFLDVFGTVLASSHYYPKISSHSLEGIKARIFTKILKYIQGRILNDKITKNHIESYSDLYLSNFFILRKNWK